MTLPGLLPRREVQERLLLIFPEGIANRNYLTRELSASVIFTAMYIGAIEGADIWLAPKHVYRMSYPQSKLDSVDDRQGYAIAMMKPGSRVLGQQWYADNTREPIRDETLREALVVVGAAIEKANMPTTSSKPRYALRASFAALFDPGLTAEPLVAAIMAWRSKALSKGALARIALVRGGAGAAGESDVTVTFPNGETRRMKPGPSSVITKAVIESFTSRFLRSPAVLFLSESGNKVVSRDDQLAKSIGLAIKADKNLPDIILVDLAAEHPLLVFVEVVATDGPVSERRKEALVQLAKDAGFPTEHLAFVTAYLDRSQPNFRKTVGSLAWGSYAWFVSEPDGLIELSSRRGQLR
jgi:BsuBI/PstI restriction endonuclease domain/BsuBI/PstI restriction endonuclease HTH domain